MHKINFTKTFDNSYKKNIRNNRENPFFPSLKSHRVNTKRFGHKWSSYISGDVRMIWDFGHQSSIDIFLLDIGTHKLYK